MATTSTSSTDPRVIETTFGDTTYSIAPSQSQLTSDTPSAILDNDWLKNAFLIGDTGYTNTWDQDNQYYSSAYTKFTDTRLGCNIGINPKPSFTMYADVPVKGRLANRSDVSPGDSTGNYGMGRQYSEMIDDHAQRIYMSFGVPQFNSLLGFLQNAYDADQMTLARTGRANGVFYSLGKVVGAGALLVTFPQVAVLVLAGKALKALFGRSSGKFYTLKPTMHLYWSTVNTLVNTMAINRGIFPKILNTDSGQAEGRPWKLDPDYLSGLSSLMPDIFNGSFYFDMYKMANRAQRLANALFKEENESLDQGTATDYYGWVQKTMTNTGGHPTEVGGVTVSNADGEQTLAAFLNEISSFSFWLMDNDSDEGTMEKDPRAPATGSDASTSTTTTTDNFIDYLDAQFRDGSLFATFIVDHTGPVQESFSNSAVESELQNKLNSTVSDFQTARFSIADGKILSGLAGDVFGAIAGAATDLGKGLADGFTGNLTAALRGLAGSGYIDIPKHWQSSAVSLPRTTYTMTLISPYGNPMSQIMNIDIPMAMLMAGALPRSTGKASYTSPFLCQIYDRGRCQSRLAMIESLSFTRGTAHRSFNLYGNAMAVDVSFNVVDLSTIMHMPVSTGSIFSVDMTLDEDNILADYLAVLGGQSLYTQIYALPQAKLKLAKTMMGLGKFHSSAYWASVFHQSTTTGMLKYLTLGSFKVIEAAASPTASSDPLGIGN